MKHVKTVDLSTSELMSVLELVAEGLKVNAIKQVRACTGLGLKEAKGIVDNVQRDELIVCNIPTPKRKKFLGMF